MKTVNSQVRWAAAHPGQDRRLPGVATLKAPASDQRLIWGGGQGNLALGSLSTVSSASYSSARRRLNVQSGLRKDHWSDRGCPSSWALKSCLREADGPVRRVETSVKRLDGWWWPLRCASKLSLRAGEEPEDHERNLQACIGTMRVKPGLLEKQMTKVQLQNREAPSRGQNLDYDSWMTYVEMLFEILILKYVCFKDHKGTTKKREQRIGRLCFQY